MATQQTKEPAKPNNLGALSLLLEKHKDQIAMALPRHMTPERMIRVALTAVSSTPALAECTPVSIAGCIVQASILGLEPSSVLGEAYLVPFKNKKTNSKECQLIPGYMGLVKLARNSGEVSMIDAQIVYENDTFEFEKGLTPTLIHKWPKKGLRGEPIGAWAGYRLKDGSQNFEYWTLEQIEDHRDRYSKGAYDANNQLTGAWLDSPQWMYKKTVIRQLIKLMPKSVHLSTALSLDELNDAGLSQHFDGEVLAAVNGLEASSEPRRLSETAAETTTETACTE
jgi:recombination protein RecT